MKDKLGVLYDSSFEETLRHTPDAAQGIDFFEVIPDRYIGRNEADRLVDVLKSTPVVFHSLNLSLGSDESLDKGYVDEIVDLAGHLKPMWASDHLAITRIDGFDLGNLSPIRFDLGAVERIANKIFSLQDVLGIPFLIENIAYYFCIPGAGLTEADFLHRLVEKTGCGVLLDLNNVAVNAKNHEFDPLVYLDEVPLNSVQEIHIAGHQIHGDTYIDSHGEAVGEEVWNLLRFVASRLPVVNVVLERDQDIPPLDDLICELSVARNCISEGRLRVKSASSETESSFRALRSPRSSQRSKDA